MLILHNGDLQIILGTPLDSPVAHSLQLLMLGIASEEGMVSIFNIPSPALDVSYAAVIAAR